MNLQRRSIFAIVIVVVILVTIFVFSQLLFITDIGTQRPTPLDLTRTYIISQNHIVETLIHQTETASAEGVCDCIMDPLIITSEKTDNSPKPSPTDG